MANSLEPHVWGNSGNTGGDVVLLALVGRSVAQKCTPFTTFRDFL
jgi:hypothetical protein